jgi:hypothetical protein
MKIVPTFLASAVLSALLVSCASSTMDSIPTLAELAAYEKVVHARFQGEYDALEKQRASGAISQADYLEHKHRLDSKVSEKVNDAAWQKHFLAESERKADGVPTPDAPVALNPGSDGGGFYQPMTKQNFGNAIGVSGTAGMGSMRAANEQITSGQGIRQDAMSAGGTYLSKPPPGSIYDTDANR